jgi:hypothetical protein
MSKAQITAFLHSSALDIIFHSQVRVSSCHKTTLLRF